MKSSAYAVDRLVDRIVERKNPCIVGLDPQITKLPSPLVGGIADFDDPLEGVRQAIVDFNKGIIDSVADLVPAVKLQIAYYEKYGSRGMQALEESIAHAKTRDLVTIIDAKRNDISTSARAYAQAYLGKVEITATQWKLGHDADFMTVNPFLGRDSLEPFVDMCREWKKGIFILVKTSNPASADLQSAKCSDGKSVVSEKIASWIDEWSEEMVGECGYSGIGAVVGATYPEEARHLRKFMPRAVLLVPGYGAQGASGEMVTACFDRQGLGAIINSSRGILYAFSAEGSKFDEDSYGEAAREAVIKMRDDVVKSLAAVGKGSIFA
jgi:orotidine-5'-phosphate decarboxylase